ncbi:MAG TPA: ABC transporter permease [Candidatus Aquilonibacter sp.]
MIDDLGIVYAAELARRITSRPFLIGLIIGVLGITFFVRMPSFIGNAFTGANTIVLVGSPALTARAKPLLSDDYKIEGAIAPQPIDDKLLKAEHANAAVVLTERSDGLHVQVYAHDPGSMGRGDLRQALLPLQLALTTHRSASQVAKISAIPIDIQTVASKFSSANQAVAARGVAYTLIFFLYMLILLNSQLVMSSVAEEKTSRIAELLVASVDPTALLTGKILASATLGLLQLAIWIAAAIFLGGNGGAATSSAQSANANNIMSLSSLFDLISPAVILAFLIFFAIGFFQLSTLFAAGASLINRTEDLGSITMPLVLPVVGALFIAIAALGAPDSTLSVTTSFIPILAPFVMFARIAVSNVPLWQILTSLAINLAALYLIAIFAGKVYRVGMLMYGRAPSIKQMWSVIRA